MLPDINIIMNIVYGGIAVFILALLYQVNYKKLHKDLLLGVKDNYSSKNVLIWIGVAMLMYILIRGFATDIWPPDIVFYVLAGMILGTVGIREISKKYDNSSMYRGGGYYNPRGGYRRGRDRNIPDEKKEMYD